MVDLLERIGPYLGIAAFLGLSILAFLIIQQAREVRRLREWAGRAPERAGEAAEASAAAAEARGETVEEEEEAEEEAEAEEKAVEREPGRFAAWRGRVADRFRAGYAAVDRHMPIDLRYLLAVVAAGAVAAAVLTSGFGLVGEDAGSPGGQRGAGKADKVKVAVLNATQEESTVTGSVIEGVEGLADLVAKEVVKPAGFRPIKEGNAVSGLDQTTVFFDTDQEEAAEELADAVSEDLGESEVLPMIDEVRQRSGKAKLALVVGRDNADFAPGDSDGQG